MIITEILKIKKLVNIKIFINKIHVLRSVGQRRLDE